MASRENQGLQIALILFALLTVVLGVSTFMFFRKWEEEQVKSKKFSADAQKASSDKLTIEGEISELKKLMGVGANDTLAQIQEAYKKDMDAYGANLPEAQRHYRHLVEALMTELRGANARLVDSAVREQELQSKIAADEAAKKQEIAQYTQTIAKTAADAAGERAKFDQERKGFESKQNDLAKKMDEKRKELEDLASKTKSEIDQFTSQITKLAAVNTALTRKGEEDQASAESADGKVTWVNQQNRIVWLNLGRDDGLRHQTIFSVVAAGEGNPVVAEKKGSIEVTRILDRHMAEARIVDDSISDPILPGDQIFSPVYERGQIERFALVGSLDINDDGANDAKIIRELIKSNGGEIDAELDESGKRVGDLTVKTKYLIVGEKPTEKNTKVDFEEYTNNYSKLLSDADSLGIRKISARDFMHYMGYRPGEHTVAMGADANPKDFQTQYENGVQRKSSGNIGGFGTFKDRRPPSAGRRSAY